MNVKHVPGEDRGDIILYAISTCGWCRKTKELLKSLGVEYRYIDIDLLQGEEKDRVMEELKKHNPMCTAPTVVVNNKECIIGFDEEKIRKVLGR
jgi:glutaredoxin